MSDLQFPRVTPPHERRHAMMVGAVQRLGNDPEYHRLILSGAVRPASGTETVASADVDALLDYVQSQEPDYVRLMGTDRMRMQLSALIGAQAVVLLNPDVTSDDLLAMLRPAWTSTERISPDNPGPPDNPNAPSLTAKQRWEIESYIVSLREALKPGRKPRAEKPKGSGRKGVDPAEADRAWDLHHRKGKTALQIANEMGLWKDGESQYDPKTRHRVEERARYLVRAGERLNF